MVRGQLRIGQSGSREDEPEEEVAQALAAFGLEAVEPLEIDEEFALWPECVETFNLWCLVQTQWRTGATGFPEGLHYPGVEVCMKRRGIPEKRRNGVFAGIQAMEQAALKEWRAGR